MTVAFVTMAGLVYVASLAVFFRSMIFQGVVFTPMVVAAGFLSVMIAPSFFFGAVLIPEWEPWTLLVFMLAHFALLFGYVVTPTIRYPSLRGLKKAKTELASERVAFVVLGIVLTLLGLRYFNGLPPTVDAVLSMATAESPDTLALREHRLEMTKGAYFGGENRLQGLNNSVQQVGWGLMLALSGAAMAKRFSAINILLAGIAVLLAWIFVAGTGTRSPFLITLLFGAAAFSLVKRFSIPKASLAVIALLAIGILLGSYSHKMNDFFAPDNWDILGAATRFLERLTLGNGSSDVLTIVWVDRLREVVPYWTVHVRDFISALPGMSGGLPLAYYLGQEAGAAETTFRTGSYCRKCILTSALWGQFSSTQQLGCSQSLSRHGLRNTMRLHGALLLPLWRQWVWSDW